MLFPCIYIITSIEMFVSTSSSAGIGGESLKRRGGVRLRLLDD
jgi:hypothetical protein